MDTFVTRQMFVLQLNGDAQTKAELQGPKDKLNVHVQMQHGKLLSLSHMPILEDKVYLRHMMLSIIQTFTSIGSIIRYGRHLTSTTDAR